MNQDGGAVIILIASGLGLPLKNNTHSRVYCACDIFQCGCRVVVYQSDGADIRLFVHQEKDGVPTVDEFGKTSDRQLCSAQPLVLYTADSFAFQITV